MVALMRPSAKRTATSASGTRTKAARNQTLIVPRAIATAASPTQPCTVASGTVVNSGSTMRMSLVSRLFSTPGLIVV